MWRVFAIRYASRNACARANFYRFDGHDHPMPLDYFVWCARDSQRTVVIDVGFTKETAERRNRTWLCDPVEVLGALGVDVSEVSDVILTHLHYDHCGNVRAFTRANFWVQQAEMNFWTSCHAGRGEFRGLVEEDDIVDLVRLNLAGRLRLVDGDAPVVEGITVHRVGGHAAGLQVVLVETAAGRIVLASDAAHFWANLEQDEPFSIVHTLPAMYDAFDRVRALATSPAHIVPGHDPRVLDAFSAVPGYEGTVVEITTAAEPKR